MFLTRPPLKGLPLPLDLHVLGTPPTFVLSQDQTRQLNPAMCENSTRTWIYDFIFPLLRFRDTSRRRVTASSFQRTTKTRSNQLSLSFGSQQPRFVSEGAAY